MKTRFIPFIALFGLVACSFAGETNDGSVVAINADDIRADASSLNGWQYVSSGQPDTEVLLLAKNAGFTTVVDLRGESEDRGFDEAAEVSALGMSYVTLPIANADDVTFENAAAFDKILAAAEGPVLVHCASGNRVGALFALREKMSGASNDDALAAGKAAGLTSLEPVVLERLQEK
ncbi:MAG: sulfur transferase domain-containing protein [Proteobacteria bacterium]|nr:sulfur transferase domain-containing protein [Pseudomonadota bacterium]MDA0993565.1 sulfur transferase domain-containing protein [Pseudomonadota bacterium]